MDGLRFELEYATIPGVTVAFSAPFDLYGHQNPHSAATEHAILSVSESLAAAAAATEKNVPVLPRDAGRATVVSVSLEGGHFDMLRFEVKNPDGSASRVFAQDYARATVLAAAKNAFEGMDFGSLLDMDEAGLAAALRTSFHEGNKHIHSAPAYCEFKLADWRVGEFADEELSEAQRAPMEVSLVRNPYGPAIVARSGEDEYSVSMEIDEGAFVARAFVPQDDNMFSEARLARTGMQVGMHNGDESASFDIDGSGIVRADKGKLTQDGTARPLPTA